MLEFHLHLHLQNSLFEKLNCLEFLLLFVLECIFPFKDPKTACPATEQLPHNAVRWTQHPGWKRWDLLYTGRSVWSATNSWALVHTQAGHPSQLRDHNCSEWCHTWPVDTSRPPSTHVWWSQVSHPSVGCLSAVAATSLYAVTLQPLHFVMLCGMSTKCLTLPLPPFLL